MTKYALIALIAVCVTVLCLSLITRDRLCSVSMKNGNTAVTATLAYEVK
ncbi:type I toxin-antitoxin system Hok family toxin [Salmonella enterica]|nr:Hok/Gef family protein [Salmonella enterica]ELA7644444.1 type I toxin-antitoxin system Hok family toxin [Proteus mirabilis]EII2272744.1 type I toxin-antitoxin system Hok family toxin [Salmonella enterica]EIV1120473.1 type I toxin-antitoxin system Hok family toxin [Salmonella enterica]EIX2513448.1 type I toxin-antitoxin system Hok family toxin [Salmonella enterica]